MIDWLKHFPLELRQAGDSASFKGPTFAAAKEVTLLPGGSTLHLRAPRHRTEVSQRIDIYCKNEIDLSKEVFRTIPNAATRNWVYSKIFYRSWTYWLEWFGGGAGDLSMSVNLYTRAEGKEFQGVSLFYPRVFEYALINYLNTKRGYNQPGLKHSWRAPINWQSHTHLPIFSCSFELLRGDEPEQMYFMFPITARLMVAFTFSYTGGRNDLNEEMRALARKIIDSVQLELSPSSQAELERLKSDIGELSLTDEFPPLKWPVEVEDIERTPPPAPMLSRV